MVMDEPHVLVIPFPAQGHVKPLMEFSHSLVDCGFSVTFLNTEISHARIMTAISKVDNDRGGKIRFVAFPDGLGPEDDRNQLCNLSEMLSSVMPRLLEELITSMDDSNGGKIKCVIADLSMGWAFQVAAKMGILRAAFWPASAATLASLLHIPKLIEDKVIDANGVPHNNNQMIQLSPTMVPINTEDLLWKCMGDAATQQSSFNLILKSNENVQLLDYFFCNSSYDLEQAAFELYPSILPIGPILASSSIGNFWPKDSTCLSWLDQQKDRSVIYVAFGSFTVFNKQHFEELAIGLELLGRPFLWVVRPDLMSGEAAEYPKGFIERVASRGQMVTWAPQKDVLAHSSIACFLSHCGWNSTLEGLSLGVSFLCWPYFADQFLNQSYICDVWKVGLKLKPNENGVVSRDELKTKVDMLLGNEEIKLNTKKLKELATRSVSHGGASLKNLDDFSQKIIKG